MKDVLGVIHSRREAGEDMVVLSLRSELAAVCTPGQFLNVRLPGEGDDPLLRRPFSVYWTEPEEEIIELLIQVRGRGTRILGETQVGAALSLLGPLGNGFPAEALAASGAVDLVAGACGSAPLCFLGQWFGQRHPGVDVRFFLGARTRSLLPEPELLEARLPGVLLATDDGSLGYHGNVARLFSEKRRPGSIVCACGPTGLLEALRRAAVERRFTCYLSLEVGMACGFGACQGCVVLLASGAYATVCRDGPVFEAAHLAPLTSTPPETPTQCR